MSMSHLGHLWHYSKTKKEAILIIANITRSLNPSLFKDDFTEDAQDLPSGKNTNGSASSVAVVHRFFLTSVGSGTNAE